MAEGLFHYIEAETSSCRQRSSRETTAAARVAFEAKCLDLERRQGLSSEQCRWNPCESGALRDRAFCARHCEQRGLEPDLSHAQSLVLRRFLYRCLA